MALGSTQILTEMSTRNISWGGKGGRCLGLTTLPPSCTDCLEIWEPQPHGTFRAYSGLYREFFTFFSTAQQPPWGPRPPHLFEASRPHFRHTTLGRTPLDEGAARRRDLYLTTHNTHNRQTYMPPAGFEPTIPITERPQTHALERTATEIGHSSIAN
jgi:hypothetical protein